MSLYGGQNYGTVSANGPHRRHSSASHPSNGNGILGTRGRRRGEAGVVIEYSLVTPMHKF